tara:strand:+ start:65 stop:472 length:408 start_codon:yes stop_codon:yes gene_type:complete
MTDKRSEYVSQKLIDSFYEKVAEDVANNIQDKGVWTKAFAKVGGDEQKAKALYIELMVDELILRQEAIAEDEDEKRLQKLKNEKNKKLIETEKAHEERMLKAQEWAKLNLPDFSSVFWFALLFVIFYVTIGYFFD